MWFQVLESKISSNNWYISAHEAVFFGKVFTKSFITCFNKIFILQKALNAKICYHAWLIVTLMNLQKRGVNVLHVMFTRICAWNCQLPWNVTGKSRSWLPIWLLLCEEGLNINNWETFLSTSSESPSPNQKASLDHSGSWCYCCELIMQNPPSGKRLLLTQAVLVHAAEYPC